MGGVLKNKEISESDLYLALEDLVIYTLKKQLNCVANKGSHPAIEWAKEECTVRFQGPRQCGHSTAIVKLCKYIFEKPLIITQNLSEVHLLKEKFYGMQLPYIASYNFIYRIKDFDYDGIIIDNASTFDNLQYIYNVFAGMAYRAGSFCFVLVG